MNAITKYITSEIKLSTYNEKLSKTEVLFEEHILVWLISGVTKIIHANSTYTFEPGDVFLIPRNQLISVVLMPLNGVPHKSVAMHLTTPRLKDFYYGLKVMGDIKSIEKIPCFQDHPLLSSYLASLLPYFEMEGKFPNEIASLKISEAISILRVIDNSIDAYLANFEQPGKIDLSKFMEKNYMFNVPMEKFGYLTGRSLTTFKRDFQKIFKSTPQKWLTQKRLELAHYQLAEESKTPIEVYYEVGFENLSHFSYVFKKQFGYSPSSLVGHKSRN
ncbi:MAG: helix-turn-helix transcriptional regulator [Bacteroidetes bacterium]|nr:helix-turn-helix transcriptional regulator [Bacteroidota bacterium]